MFDVEYSIMVHYPSLVSKDCITIALHFYNKTTKEAKLIHTKKWDRVRSFNDDLDIDLIKLQLEGIDEEIHTICKAPDFNLNKYIKFYQNSLKFLDVTTACVIDFDSFVAECSRQYLILDCKKSERPSKNEQLTFIKNYLKTESIECEKNVINGYFDESVTFDFIIGDYAFKLFRFQGRHENRLIKTVKDWGYNAIKLRDKYKIIFITDLDTTESKYPTLIKILNEDCYKLISFTEVLSFIKTIEKKQSNVI